MVAFGRENKLFPDGPEAWTSKSVYPSAYSYYNDAAPTVRFSTRYNLQRVQNLLTVDFFQFDLMDREDFDTLYYNVLDAFRAISEKLSFDREETDLVESVITLYGAQTQDKLILLSINEKPWVEARGNLKPYEKSSTPISLDTMYTYYHARHQRNRKG